MTTRTRPSRRGSADRAVLAKKDGTVGLRHPRLAPPRVVFSTSRRVTIFLFLSVIGGVQPSHWESPQLRLRRREDPGNCIAGGVLVPGPLGFRAQRLSQSIEPTSI